MVVVGVHPGNFHFLIKIKFDFKTRELDFPRIARKVISASST